MINAEVFQDILNYVARLTGRYDIPLSVFEDNINLWLLNVISLLDYDDCLFIPLITNVLKHCCCRYIPNTYIENPQKFICLNVVNPSIIALERKIDEKLLLYKTLVDLENILRYYNIKHEFLCKILSVLTKLLIDIEYFNIINNSHGRAPAHVLRLCINSLSPFIIKLTSNSKSCYWTGLFNSLLRIKLEFTVSNVILNLEIASNVTDQKSDNLPLLIAETFKVYSMVSMLQRYLTLELYVKRVSKLKEDLITRYCFENLTPVMTFYKCTLIELLNHKNHNNLPGLTNNPNLVMFDLNNTAYTTIMPRYIRLLVRLYMTLMLRLPKIGYSCTSCRESYIQQHLHFIYEILDYANKISKKIGELMKKDPVTEFESVFVTLKSIIICLVGSEHILSMNWFSHCKKLPYETSKMLHAIALKYSPCQSIISILKDIEPLSCRSDNLTIIEQMPTEIPNEVVSVLIDNEWVDVRVMHESHLLVFRDNNLLISIVDLRLVTGVIKCIIPLDDFKSDFNKGHLIKLITDEWRFGGIERLDGLSHQPFVIMALSSEELRDLFFTALKLLLDSYSSVGDWWIYPRYRHFDSETELASYFKESIVPDSTIDSN